ncbi:MAG: non-heme iron oxygenase ferredoxin subunit [Gammaproteobacteria bacterium]|nr:non-heme iron oxygenase ferredoxin subunit [Gammaproteobacteria bacterium]
MPNRTTISIPLAEIPEGRMLARSAGGREIMVCRTKDGVFAVDDICSHAYARLSEGRLRGFRAICPLHGAAFDVRTGAVLGAPATRPIECFTVSCDATHATITVTDAPELPTTPPPMP